MAAIVATVGAANANSYGTLAEAATYFATRPHSAAWTAATNPDKIAVLIWATLLLDIGPRDPMFKKNIVYKKLTGAAATTTQALAWPRSGMKDKNGNDISEGVVPMEVKRAQFELALSLLLKDRTLESDVAVQGLTRLVAGPVELAFKDDVQLNQNVIPEAALAMMPFDWYISRAIVGPLVTGQA